MGFFVALIRGVNVGGNMLKMERLREVWADMGVSIGEAKTYLQSGNVVFEAKGTKTQAKWVGMMEEVLSKETRLPVSVVVRSSAEWGAVVKGNPFLAEKGVDKTRLYVTFLAQAAEAGAKKLQDAMKREKRAAGERLVVVGREIFVHCPAGYGGTVFSNNWVEKVLGMRATTRNWNTVVNVWGMLGGN